MAITWALGSASPAGAATGFGPPVLMAIPHADAREHDHRDQREEREEGNAALSVGHDDPHGEQWTDRRAGVAANLKDGLRQAIPPTRGHARDPRGFGMEDRRAGADHRGRHQQHGETGGERQRKQTQQGKTHAHGERKGLGMAVGVESDQRLQQRSGQLKGQGDQANLGKAQVKPGLEQRVDRDHQRLHGVVEKMGKTDRA